MSHHNTGRTLSAMYDTRAEADRAIEALRAIGLSDVTIHGEQNTGYDANAKHDEDRGFFDSLGDFFFPDEDRATYAEGLHRGGYLVTAKNVPESHVAQALEVLEREGAVDLDRREQEWRQSGWSADAVRGTRPATDGDKIDVVEEQLHVGKRDVDLGTVRARSYVREVPVSQDIELTEEKVTIERRPVDRAAGADAFQEKTIEAHVSAEEAVISKEARVVEEIALNKTAQSHTETVTDTLRKTEVEIDDTKLHDKDADPKHRI